MNPLLAVAALLTASILATQPVAGQKKNVLFFAVDDLRPDLGTYGSDYVKSPNIDKLASQSMVFERAYIQVAICSPSRTSLLTGRRPDTNHVWEIANDEYWRHFTNATTIPQYFKENGYVSAGMGKIFHPGAPNGNDDRAYSWSVPYFHAPDDKAPTHTSWHTFDTDDSNLWDGKIATNAVNTLNEIKQNRSKGDNRPFFLAVGFHKPHLPWYCAKKYYDMYPPAEQIALPENPDITKDLPPVARGLGVHDFTRYIDTNVFLPNFTKCNTDVQASFYEEGCNMPENYTRVLRRSYYSCISQTDALVGRVIDAMESMGFADDTIIVFWGDHGWQLGEHNTWCKMTNYEDGTRVPFIIKVPGVTDGGMRTKSVVELIDIFPTLTELAGLPVPPLCPADTKQPLVCVEGTSLTPLLKDPSMQLKKAAFSQFARPYFGMTVIPGKPAFKASERGESVMGYTMRVDQYRFTEWYRFNRTTATPNFTDIWGTELYNHTEPVVFFNDENINMANQPDKQDLVQKLRKMLQAGWRAALP